MDKRQKSTLRSQHLKIADELILDEDFYAALRRDKIFTNGMLDLIKAEVTPRDKVYKMLELLEKRGPKAFDNFVWILKENYEWLAKDLEDQYARRIQLSQQERDIQEQKNAKHETNTKYFDQDIYHRVEYQRSISSPPNRRKARQTMPMQESVSAGYNTKDSCHFFHRQDYDHDTEKQHQMKQSRDETGLDDTDVDAVGVRMQTSDETDSRPQKKEYKDACMSPIGIIESQRIVTTNLELKELNGEADENRSEAESYDQGFDEIQSQTATLSTLNNDDVASTTTRETDVNSDGLGDNVDGPEDVNVALDDNDEDFPSSEVYYDCVRRGSSRFSHFEDAFHPELDIKDDENDRSRSELSYEHSEAFHIQMNAMRNMYKKLVEINFENEEIDDIDNTEVTWDMIECEIDRLIDRLENSDDIKMIRKCLRLFPEKERRQPLNVCINSLLTDKKEYESKLKDKQKEIDQMVFDLWKHQQDMSNLKKLQKKLSDQETDLNNYRTSLENLEKDADIKLKQIAEKDQIIEKMELRLRELQGDQQRKPGIHSRRGPTAQRRVSNAQGQSPRRQSNNYGDPRFSLVQGGYGNIPQSPRSVTTAMRRAPSNRR